MIRLFFAAFLLLSATGEAADFEVIDVAGVAREGEGAAPIPVALFLPASLDPEDGPYPLFLFSHGFGGSGGSYRYLTDRLADAGWIVAAPDHADTVSVHRLREGEKTVGGLRLAIEAKRLIDGEFDFDAHAYRLDETDSVLSALVEHERLGPLIDRDRIAMGGHSFGGYTTLGVAGAVEGRQNSARAKAVVLLSPGLWMFTDDDFARVDVPVLYMLGERELHIGRGDGTKHDLARRAIDALDASETLSLALSLDGGQHLSFSDRAKKMIGKRRREKADADLSAIAEVVAAFLEEHVGGNEAGSAAKSAERSGRFEGL